MRDLSRSRTRLKIDVIIPYAPCPQVWVPSTRWPLGGRLTHFAGLQSHFDTRRNQLGAKLLEVTSKDLIYVEE